MSITIKTIGSEKAMPKDLAEKAAKPIKADEAASKAMKAELAKKAQAKDVKPVDKMKAKEKPEYDIDWIAYAFASAIV